MLIMDVIISLSLPATAAAIKSQPSRLRVVRTVVSGACVCNLYQNHTNVAVLLYGI
jgi:hypothetical protein